MHVMVPIATGYKENKSCCDGKKRGVAKICSGKPAINGYQKIFHTPDDRRPTAIDIYIYIYIYILYLYRTGIHFREDTVGLGNKTLWYSLKFLMKKMLLRSINWKYQNKD